jgi:hypothetical protein
MNFLNKLKNNLRKLKKNPSVQRFMLHNRRVFPIEKEGVGKRPIVLFELNSMQSAHIAYSYLANVLADLNGAEIKAYAPYSFSNWRERIMFKLKMFLGVEEFGVYQSFGVTEIFAISPSPSQKNRAADKVEEIKNNLRKKLDIEALTVNGVWIGDLVYDSYLKKFSQPTIDLKSPQFLKFLRSSLELFFFWEDYFAQNDVRAVNVSHCVYNLAMPLRIAVQRCIPAYQANIHHIYRLDSNNLFAYNDFFNFRKIFSRLPIELQASGIEMARERIGRRFSGEVGVDMIYSTKSAYGSVREDRLLRDSPRKKILIAAHCFFDSPHSYGNNIFPDFYEWLDFLGKTSEETDYDWYIKTHPDYLPGTMEIIKSFVERYPKFTLLPSDASHHQIIAEGIDVALTVYGTIAFEYAAFGIPVINASQNNPHIAYDFNLHAKDLNDYRRLIHGVQEMNFPIDLSSVYEYYFMKNLFFSWDIFFKSFNLTIIELGGYNNLFSALVYDRWLQEWNREAHEALLDRLTNFLRSNTFRFAPQELKYLLP